MKTLLNAALAVLLLALPAAAAELALAPSSRLWLEGDSSLHPYSSTAAVLNLAFTLEAPGPAAAAISTKAPARMTLRIPVADLKSAHAGLDKNLRKTLKAAEHPDIVFTLRSYALKDGNITAEGELTVAGRSRGVVLAARYGARDGAVTVEGEQALLMSDFGIKPPSMMLGAIKTADAVTVKYRLELVEAADPMKEPK